MYNSKPVPSTHGWPWGKPHNPWGWAILEGKKLIVYIKLGFFISKKKKIHRETDQHILSILFNEIYI